MAVVDGSWSECSDDSWYDVVNDDDQVVEVIGYDDDDKEFLNGDQGIVDSFVKLPRPDYQVIRADQKEIKAMLKQLETKEKKRGASESDSSNDIISCIKMVMAATVIFGLFSLSNFRMLVYLTSLLLVLAATTN